MTRYGESKLPEDYYTPQSRVIEAPCVAFSPYFPPENSLPLYGHRCSTYTRYSPFHGATASHVDLMKTVDLRHIDFPTHRRSSFDLSIILEEDAEIDISDILPPSPVSTRSSSSSVLKSITSLSGIGRRLKVALTTTKISTLVVGLCTRCRRAGPPPVVNDGSKIGLDLLA